MQVELKLPWQSAFKNLGLLPICNQEIVLPLKLAFLCHAKEDKTEVEAIREKLLSDGFLTWYADKDLLPGDEWELLIEREIEGCDYFLAFLSSRSVSKTGYVQRELRHAMKQRTLRPHGKRYIIPIQLDDCEVPPELSEIHFLKMWQLESYDRLLTAMSEGEDDLL